MIDPLKRLEAVAAPLREEAVRSLRSAIVNGRLQPGQRLVQRDLCELLGISRPPMREAMRALEGEGLIESIPNRGAIVARVTVEDARGMLQTIGALFALAAKLFAREATDQEVAKFGKLADDLGRSGGGTRTAGVLSPDLAVFDLLLAGSRNRALASTVRSLDARMKVFWGLSRSRAPSILGFVEDIRSIRSAIARRDADESFRLATRHADNALAAALSAMEPDSGMAREQAGIVGGKIVRPLKLASN